MRIAVIGAELEENLAVRYIRAALDRDGHQVIQVDFNAADETEAVARSLATSAPTIVGMSMVFTARAREFVALARRARALGYSGHIIVGGHFAALNAEALLRDAPAIDSVGLGEGEALLCSLARCYPELDRVPGLAWRAADGRIVRNSALPAPADLGGLAWPVRRCPPDSYLGMPIVNMLSSRGCGHACAFCSIAAWHRFCGGPRHRLRAVDDVADEMASLHASGIRIFNFHDDNFLLRDRAAAHARILALRDALDARGVARIAFAIKARPDDVNRDLFRLLQSMGLFRVFLGIEAGTATSLRALGRGQDLGDNERAIDVVNGLGLHMCFNLLLLNPDSTLEDMAANVAFLRRRPDNPMNFCRTEIYAGTPLERKLRREGRLLGDYFGYDYRIADERAELACNLSYDAFGPRNYGGDCLHHKVMDLDYENTLLNHFYPWLGNVRLTARVKSFVRRANLNTCAYLERVISTAAEGVDEARYTPTVDMFCRAMRADEARLVREANHLLDQIRSRAAGSAAPTTLAGRFTPVSRSRTVVAAAGLAASFAVGGFVRADEGAKAGESSQKPSVEPRPDKRGPPEPAWHMFEMAPPRPPERHPPTRPTPPKPSTEQGKDAELRNLVAQKVLKTAARHLRQATPVELQITLDKKGKIKRVIVETPKPEASMLEKMLRRISFKSEGRLADRSLSLSFTSDEVRSQMALTRKRAHKSSPTHNKERVPLNPRMRSHPNEEIPW